MKKSNLDSALEIYFQTFGKNYPVQIGQGVSEKDIIKDIKKCIERNTEAKPKKYDENNVY